jgi:hypothetical protein
MTAQINDICIFQGRQFQIVGVNGAGLFDPADYGVLLQPCSTAMWRGFRCRYVLLRNRLFLRELEICHQGDVPNIFGLGPNQPNNATPGRTFFQDLSWPLRFDGSLLLGADFISELYVHMGFHPAWKYREVFELEFKGGRLVATNDRSAAMAEVRERKNAQPPGEAGSAENPILGWIRNRFSLFYKRRDS